MIKFIRVCLFSVLSIAIGCGVGFADCDTTNNTDITCDPGEYIGGENCECIPCPAGQYKTGTNSATSCTKCPAGTYAAQTGSTECTLCPVGRYADQEGSTSCKFCALGTYAAQTGSTECTLCPAGRYADQEGSTSCKFCALGTYAAQTGSTECLPCPIGTHALAVGAEACESCAEGTYAEEEGMALCEPCPPGYCCTDSLDHKFVCKRGTWSGGGLVCQKHNVQYYNNDSNNCSINRGGQSQPRAGGTCSISTFVYEEGMCNQCNGPCTTSGEGARTIYSCTEKTVKNIMYNNGDASFSWPNDGSIMGGAVTSSSVNFGNNSCPSVNNNN